jgi:formylglycine-generating enzyme required for sulfatase activity
MRTPFQAILTALCVLLPGAAATAQAAAPNPEVKAALVPWLSITNTPGYTNQIEYSEDLGRTNWAVLTNAVVAESPGATNQWFFDVDARNAAQRFYRAVSHTNNSVKNIAPQWNPIGNQTLNVLDTLSLTANATDADTVQYSLASAPTNMTINTRSGLILWTPNAAQGGTTNTVSVQATDTGAPPLSALTQFTVTVKPDTTPVPTLTIAPTNQTLEVNQPLAVTVASTPATNVTFALITALTNMTFNPNTGLIIWTPNVAQGSTNYTIKVIVTANGQPPKSTTNSFTVTVNAPSAQTNKAPTLNAIADMIINENSGLQTVNLSGITAGPVSESSQTLTITATSGNTAIVPNPAIQYTSPNTTGTLTFTPVANASGSATITVIVKDNGGTSNGGVDAVTNRFLVTVNAQGSTPAGMAPIPAGAYIRGDANDGNQLLDAPTNQVWVSAFFMDTNSVTYSLWTNVFHWATNHGYSFSTNVGKSFGTGHPVQAVSWYDAVKWCNARSEMEGNFDFCYYTNSVHSPATVYRNGQFDLTTNQVNWAATGYRLPTEAEWEKAARGNLTTNRFPRGMTISTSQAWYTTAAVLKPYDLGPASQIRTSTTRAGSFPPNGYGLYDMAGNVRQWCWDRYLSTYYKTSPTNNPLGPDTGSSRTLRGGNWNLTSATARCFSRTSVSPTQKDDLTGFRCVRRDPGQ